MIDPHRHDTIRWVEIYISLLCITNVFYYISQSNHCDLQIRKIERNRERKKKKEKDRKRNR